MSNHIQRETRRSDLRRRLRNAAARKLRAEAEIEDVEGELAWMDEQEDLDLFRSWRGKPDWDALLKGKGTTCRYMLANYFAEWMGLRLLGLRTDTDQQAIGLSVPTSEDSALAGEVVERRRRAIEAIAPFIIPARTTSTIRFNVYGTNVDGFALELRLSRDLSDISLVKMQWGGVVEATPFATIGEALIHIQTTYPAGDVADEVGPQAEDAPGQTGDALRAALAAFLDGCRSAGMPLEHPGFRHGSASARPTEGARLTAESTLT